MLAGRDAGAQGLQRIVERGLRQHRLVGRRRGAEVGDAELGDGFEHRSAGVACSIVARAAPKRSGNSGVMPSPKVKAIGALVMKTSPGFGPTRCFAKLSHGASTSRWNWTQPLGTPVVPLVKAISAGSSRCVSTGGSGSSERGARLQLALPVVAVIFDDVLDEVRLLDRLAEVADEAAVDDRMADLRRARSPSRSRPGGAAAWSRRRRRPPSARRARRRKSCSRSVRAAARDCRGSGPLPRPAAARCAR